MYVCVGGGGEGPGRGSGGYFSRVSHSEKKYMVMTISYIAQGQTVNFDVVYLYMRKLVCDLQYMKA